MKDDTLTAPEPPPLETESKPHRPWYRRVMGSGLGTASIYLKKPVLPPLVEYQNLLLRRNPRDRAVHNDQNHGPPRGVEAYQQEHDQPLTASTNPEQSGSEVKILRRFRFLDGGESLRPCPVDIGVGGKIVMDPTVRVQPVARVRVADCATMMFLPEPILKLSKTLPFHWQGMQAHFRYEVPVASLRHSWWRPPARMLIRFEHGSNSGFHLYPGGLEFGDHTVPLTSDGSVALRVAAGLTFPREYPMRPDNGPQWEVYRLGIKTTWTRVVEDEEFKQKEWIPKPSRSSDASSRRSCSFDSRPRFSYEASRSSYEDSTCSESQRPSSFLYDSAQTHPSPRLGSLEEEEEEEGEGTKEVRQCSDDSASASVFGANEKTKQEEHPTIDPETCQQIVALYLQLMNKRVEDLTQQDYLVINQLISNSQVKSQNPTSTVQSCDPYSAMTLEEQALLDAYQNPSQVQSSFDEILESSDHGPSLNTEEQDLLVAHQNQSQLTSLGSGQSSDPYLALSPEEQALLGAYQNPPQQLAIPPDQSQDLDPFAGLSEEERAMLEAYQNPCQEQDSEEESLRSPDFNQGLTAQEQALLDACQHQLLQQMMPSQDLSNLVQNPGMTAEDQALLDAYQGAFSHPVEEESNSGLEKWDLQEQGVGFESQMTNPNNRTSQNSNQGVRRASSSSFFGSSSGLVSPTPPFSSSGGPGLTRSVSGRSSETRSSFAEEQRVVRPSMDIAGGHYTRFSGVQGTIESQNYRQSGTMSLISERSSQSTIQDPDPIPQINLTPQEPTQAVHQEAERLKMIRSSFAAETRGLKSTQQPPLEDLELFQGISESGKIKVTTDSLVSELLRRYHQLVVFPEDSLVPLSVLAMLWGTVESVDLVDAEETAWIMEGRGILRISIVDDASMWCIMDTIHHQKLTQIMDQQLKDLHSRLINLYRQGFNDLAVVPDDGYFMKNIARHLTEAGRFTEFAELLKDPIWLETKLRSYGTAAVVSDFRVYFTFQEDSDLKLMLRAFQISAKAALDHSTLYVLKEQMLGRLMVSAEQSPGIQEWLNQGLNECKKSVPYRRSKSMPVHLIPKTPSLEQAGGLQRLILKGHTRAIQKVELTPNGLEVITASIDGTVRVWDLEIGDFVLKLDDHGGPVSCLELSKDGKTLVVGGEDGVATVYDLPSGIWRHKLKGHIKKITGVQIDAHSKRLVTASQDMTTRIWSLTQGVCLHVLMDAAGAQGAVWDDWMAHHAVAISPDASIVATVDGDFSVRVWMMETGMLLQVLEGHSDWVVALIFAGEDGLLLTASHDKTLRLWDLCKGLCKHVFEGHGGRINNLVVTEDGNKAVSVSDDAIGIVWDVKGHSKVCELIGHGSWINDAAITQDGSRVVTVSGDELAILWDAEIGTPLRILNGHSSEIKSVSISYKGRFAITGSEDSTARVWDLFAPSTHLEDSHQGKVTKVLHHPGSPRVVTIGEDNRAMIWNINTSQLINTITPNQTNLNFSFLGAEGNLLITASGDRCVCVWDLTTGECLNRLPPHAGSRVKSISVSPDGKTAVICLFDSTVSVWNLESMELTNWLMKRAERDGIHVHSAAVNEVVITGDGSNAITISKDSTGRLWSLETCLTTLILRGHSDGVKLVSLKADGTACMTAGYDKTARVWNLTKGECLMVLDHPSEIDFLVTDPHWRRAVTVAGERTIWLWDIAKGRCLGILESHGDHLSGVVFSSDGRFLATYSHNSVVRVWTASSGKLRAVFVSDSGISSCEFVGSSQIDTLVVGDGNGHVHFLDFLADELSPFRSRKLAIK